MGLGPGGQPIDATMLNRGGGNVGGMGNMGPGGNKICFWFVSALRLVKLWTYKCFSLLQEWTTWDLAMWAVAWEEVSF